MERYHELYRLCLAGTAAGMLLSVFLFIRLKICMAVKVLSRKGGKQGGRKSKRVKREKKRREAEVCREEKTVRIAEGIVDFLMIEEILLVHTKEWIGN